MSEALQIEALQARVAALEEALGLDVKFPPGLKFYVPGWTKPLFGLLLKREFITYEAGYAALFGDRAEPLAEKSFHVAAAQLRRSIRPHGIDFERQWGVGYYMTSEMKARAHVLIEQKWAEFRA